MNGLQTISKGEVILTDESLYNSFLEYLDVRPKSVETYRTAIRQFIKYLMENDIKNPTRQDIIDYREYLKKDHKPNTVQNYLTAVKLFFAWMEQQGFYKDVASHVKGVKISKEHKKGYLTQYQSRRLLESVDTSDITGKRDYALIGLLITTGLRTVEIERANVGDIETIGGFTALFVQGKGRDEKAEYVKIAEPVEDAIRDYLGSRSAKRAEKSEPLFASTSNNNRGERMTTRSIRRIVKGRLINAGYDSDMLTAHSMRHTAATLNLLNGGTLEETQQLLRHQNISTTMIYSHALERAGNKSEDRIASGLFPTGR
jgi:integrase/recombinase XerC